MKSKYLRISVDDTCNMDCYFCHNEGQRPEKKRLSAYDIIWLSRIAKETGFDKFKITGGEPTLREDLPEIISGLSKLDIADISMITNGTRLKRLAQPLKDSGLERINVSLMSINQQYHSEFMGRDRLRETLEGIDAALEAGFSDMKLNHILHSASYEHISNLKEVASYAKERSLAVVVIPLLNYGLKSADKILEQPELSRILKAEFGARESGTFQDEENIYHTELMSERFGRFILKSTDLNNVQPYHACNSCTVKENCQEGIFPMRLSSSGKIKPCLAGGVGEIDLYYKIKSRDEDSIRNALTYQY